MLVIRARPYLPLSTPAQPIPPVGVGVGFGAKPEASDLELELLLSAPKADLPAGASPIVS